jgi:hypothetical protein
MRKEVQEESLALLMIIGQYQQVLSWKNRRFTADSFQSLKIHPAAPHSGNGIIYAPTLLGVVVYPDLEIFPGQSGDVGARRRKVPTRIEGLSVWKAKVVLPWMNRVCRTRVLLEYSCWQVA